MEPNGRLREREELVEIGGEVASHLRQAANDTMRVVLRLADQNALASIWVAAQADVAIVGNPSVVLEDVAVV